MDRRKFIQLSKKGLLTSALISGFPQIIKANTNHDLPSTFLNGTIPSESVFYELWVSMSVIEKAITSFNTSLDASFRRVTITLESVTQNKKAQIQYSISEVVSEWNNIYKFKLKFEKLLESNFSVSPFLTKDINKLTFDTKEKAISIYNDKGVLEATLILKKNNDDYLEDDWECFLTTACVVERGLPDNCEELMKLRSLRDNHILKTSEGKRMIEEYYLLAPKVISEINKLENRTEFYNHLYNTLILPSVDMINEGFYEDASMYYINYVEALRNKLSL